MPLPLLPALAGAGSMITILGAIKKAMVKGKGVLAANAKETSLVEYTRGTRAEFVTLLEDSLSALPHIDVILQNSLSLCTAYYLQAAAVDTTVSGVRVVDRLNKINPNRYGSVGKVISATMEGIDDDAELPNYLSMEAAGTPAAKVEGYGGVVGGKLGDTIKAYDSMIVGKNVEVSIIENGQKAVIPVTVRLNVLGASGNEITDILALASGDVASKVYNYRFRPGTLAAIREMLLCDNQVNLHRKTLLKEKSGFYAATLKRRAENKLAALASGEVSLAAASSIIIISKETQLKVEAALGGKLDNDRIREIIFQTTSSMILIVVDTKWEEITMYVKSQDLPYEAPVSRLKQLNKDGGEGILDAMQKLLAGKPL